MFVLTSLLIAARFMLDEQRMEKIGTGKEFPVLGREGVLSLFHLCLFLVIRCFVT